MTSVTCCCSTPFGFETCLPRNTQKEEREAHLTGGHDCQPCSHSSNPSLRTWFLEHLATLDAWLRAKISVTLRSSPMSITARRRSSTRCSGKQGRSERTRKSPTACSIP